ncbi:MAG: nucleotidyltransferase family protein [Clostridiales bacterium]|nr:nucleotidyltransferase family protein [Clostridiales bacterium]
MIKGTAVAAEFNPLHNGHKYIMKQAKIKTGSDFAGVVMSGSFTQRGEPAAFDKFSRTKAALLNGADIVLELPVVYATGAADIFARGCCETIIKAGIFVSMVFGCETENMGNLEAAGEILACETDNFKLALRENSQKGFSYPKARELALCSVLSVDSETLSSPNNILAVEYIKQLKILNSDVVPVGIKRLGSDYNDERIYQGFSSAAAVRKALEENRTDEVKKAVPENVFSLYIEEMRKPLPTLNDFGEALRYLILKKGPDGLREISDITEGLENKIYKNSDFETVDGLIDSLKSKRYTRTKLIRGLLHILLDIKKSDVLPPKPLPYIRVLGVKNDKKHLLKDIREKSSLPVIINPKKDVERLSVQGKEMFEKEIFASNLYNIKEKAVDFTKGLIII